MKTFCLLTILCLGAGLASAQNPAAVQQADSWRWHDSIPVPATSSNAAPEFYSGETSDVGPQTLLQLKPRRTYVQASLDEQYFYTDNMFLTDHGKQGADVSITTIQAALAPSPYEFQGGLLAPRAGYQHQWFSYGLLDDDRVRTFNFTDSTYATNRLNKFDFNVQTVFSDVSWGWENWDFTAGLDFRQFLDSGNYREFYREAVPRWAMHRTFQITENKSILLGYEGDYRFTQTENPLPLEHRFYNDRTDHSLVLLGNWAVCPHFIVQPFYRLQYSYYPRGRTGREDWLNSFGLALNFPFTKNIALRTFVSCETLHTDGAYVQSYDKLDAGGGLNLTVRF